MKKILIYIAVIALCWSCNNYLDIVPDNVPTLEHAFLNRTTSFRYLASCYNYMPSITDPASDPAFTGSDEWYCEENEFYEKDKSDRIYNGLKLRRGLQSVDKPLYEYWSGSHNAKGMYKAIRDCNIFLENIVNVKSDLSEEERLTWIGEVKFLKAYYHFYLFRLYGPIPVIRQNLPVAATIDETRVFREPVDDVVSYIVQLLDEAIEVLPSSILNRSTDMGHITKPAAMALKADVLVTAASDFFNGNTDMIKLVNPDGARLFPEYDANKWSTAATACKEALDEALAAGHSFYHMIEYPNISDSTRLILSLKQVTTERWNSEIVWSMSKQTASNLFKATAPYWSQAQHKFAPYNPYMAPTLTSVEFFYTKNGVPMSEDNSYPYSERYNVVRVPENHSYYAEPNYQTMQLNIDREPRYYANIAFDGARWFGNGRYKEVGLGNNSDEESYVFQMKNDEEQGKNGALRFSPTGFWAKKTSHIASVYANSNAKYFEPASWPLYRLSDLYLMYAEALNESLEAPNQEVYTAIDQVRAKSGLNGVVESWSQFSIYPNKPSAKDGMREIIRNERTIELAFEGKRFYDIRRWKTAQIVMNAPVKGLNINSSEVAGFNQIRVLDTQSFFVRDYLMPIRTTDMRINRNLVQNPHW